MRTTDGHDRNVVSRWLPAIVFGFVVAAGCSAAPSRGFDTRPLSQRSAIGDLPVTVRPSWWRTVEEASPATRWMLDGERVEQGTLFVEGPIVSVEPGFAIADKSGEVRPQGSTRPPVSLLEFNAANATTDVVIITLDVRVGLAETGPAPRSVKIALPLPAPTDLPSLRAELVAYGSLAAIVFLSADAPGPDDLYRILDSRYLGTLSNAGKTLTFGKLMTGPDEGRETETVEIEELLAGAGTIELLNPDGDRVRP